MDDTVMDWDRLERYLRRVGTAAELDELERWVAADPQRRALADAMRGVGRSPDRTDSPRVWDAERALRRVRRQRGAGTFERRVPQLRLADRSRSRRLEFALSAVAAAALIAVFIFSDRTQPPRPPEVALAPARELVTAPGQRASLLLADGTRLALSPESHVRVPAGFGSAQGSARLREVWLEGEASFAVRHDSVLPFVVHTPSGTVQDLGTEFVLSTYPEVHGLRVAVRDGRVAIHAGEREDTLGRGDIARLTSAGRLTVVRHQEVELYYAGPEGALVLAGTRLREAIPRLERWYGIHVRVTDPELLKRTVSGAFRDESATTTLGIIALALESKASWRGNEVTLEPNHGTGETQ